MAILCPRQLWNKKPDKIKPASGLLQRVEVIDQSAMLTWAFGSSSDLVLQELWRENDLLQKKNGQLR